ncbi:MAG: hypothetical protein R3251_01970 [Candidatus Spechtbacterales bacterium]|nr:hypothetical protein [Candidatus Spechtbacterales bacterium]
MAKKKLKLKTWHLMPLSLIILIIAAALVWAGRSDFSTRNVSLAIEGPAQVENGKAEEYKLVVTNDSSKALTNLNLTLETGSTITVAEGADNIRTGIERVAPGETKELEFKLVASSTNQKEKLNARLDYSPEGISARFVELTSLEIVIGRLDVSVIFDLPPTIFADQEIKGTIHIIPHSDIQTSPIYLRLDAPSGFRITETSHNFDYETVWKLGELKEEQSVKREFRGKLSSYEGSPDFSISLGRLEGISFLSLHRADKEISISESPLALNLEHVNSTNNVITPGGRVIVRAAYENRSDIPMEDAILKVSLPRDTVDFSSISPGGGLIDEEEGTIEWTSAQASKLRFIDVGEGGDITFSFTASQDIEPANAQDSNKTLNIAATLRSGEESLELGGTLLQARSTLSLKLKTKLALSQDVFRSNSDSGPHPPKPNQLSTYTVRWVVTNTTNDVSSAKVEAVLPDYALWRDETAVSSGDLRYISDTNTVVWDLGEIEMGTGFVYSEEEAQFVVGIIPEADDVQDGVNILEQTKLSGIDSFTSTFLEQDIGEEPAGQ